jgi:DNA-binding GntR family transcriptional regulator
MAAVLSEEDLRVSVWDEHEAILHALEVGDSSRAETLCRKHAEQTADVLTTRLKAVVSRAA